MYFNALNLIENALIEHCIDAECISFSCSMSFDEQSFFRHSCAERSENTIQMLEPLNAANIEAIAAKSWGAQFTAFLGKFKSIKSAPFVLTMHRIASACVCVLNNDTISLAVGVCYYDGSFKYIVSFLAQICGVLKCSPWNNQCKMR